MNIVTPTSQADPRLQIIGRKISSVDRLMVHLLAMRKRMVEDVAMIKIEKGLAIYRKDKEIERLDDATDWAEKEGLDPAYVRSVLYMVIGESCKTQMAITDELRISGVVEKFNPTKQELRDNLIALTEAWAPGYDGSYGAAHPATMALRDYEHVMIDKAVENAPDRKLLLDLGCATGIEARRLRQQFESLQGFDISHKMVECGWGALAYDGSGNIAFDVCDIETGIPVENASVSTVIMNGGTGSDMFDFESVLKEIRRVLKPHGTFMISFYNREAWIQRTFFPWPLGLTARVDLDRNCLEVDVGTRRIPVHAKAYSVAEITDMFERSNMVLSSYATYPTISSILPAEMVNPPKQPEINKVIRSLDEAIAKGSEPLGAYIVVSGRKE